MVEVAVTVAATAATERVWGHVDRRGPDDCWPWTGARRVVPGFEYGTISEIIDGRRRLRPAHVVAWEAVNGPMPPGMCGLHSCDNPPCCNPAHVFPGTKGQNNADRDRKGRHRALLGSAHGRAKLTENAVASCRTRVAAGERIRDLAREFGVSRVAMTNAVRGKTWRHIGRQTEGPA